MPGFNFQPQYPAQVNWSNPLTRDLKGLFLPVQGTMVDVLRDALPSSETASYATRSSGNASIYNGSVNTQYANHPNYDLTSPLTIVVIADVDSLTHYSAIAACQTTTTTGGWELRLGHGQTDSEITIHRATNSDFKHYYASASDLISAGTINNFVAVTYADDQIDTSPNFNVNGIAYTPSSSSGTGTGTQTAPTGPLYVGSRTGTFTHLTGAITFFALWGRELSFNELEQVRANPWQLFLAPNLERTVTVVTGGTTISLTAASFAFTATSTLIDITQNLSTATFTFVARALDIFKSRLLELTAPTFNFTGQSSQQTSTPQLAAGSFSFTGEALQNTTTLQPSAASFNFIGNAIVFSGATVLTLSAASFAFTGETLTYTITFGLTAAAISFSAQTILLLRAYILDLSAAAFNFTGKALTLLAANIVFKGLMTWLRRRRR